MLFVLKSKVVATISHLRRSVAQLITRNSNVPTPVDDIFMMVFIT